MSKASKHWFVQSAKHRSFGTRLDAKPDGQHVWSLTGLFPDSGIDSSTYAGEMIAILDSGVPDHVCLTRLASGSDVSDSEHSADLTGDATAACGLLAGGGFEVMGLLPAAKVMPIKVTSDVGIATMTTVAAGIACAVVSGAKVVIVPALLPELNGTLMATLQLAGRHGVVVVASVDSQGEAVANLLNIATLSLPKTEGLAPSGEQNYCEIELADFPSIVAGAVVAATGSIDAAKVVLGL